MFPSLQSTLLDVPRAHIDPICSLVEALAVVALATERPLISSTTALFLDDRHCGIGLATTRKHISEATHFVINQASHANNVRSVFMTTSRPGQTVRFSDADEYSAMTQLFSHAGINLIEWVVLGHGGLYCPRAFTDTPSQWDCAISREDLL